MLHRKNIKFMKMYMIEFCNVIPFDFTTNSIFKILKKTYFLKRQKVIKQIIGDTIQQSKPIIDHFTLPKSKSNSP